MFCVFEIHVQFTSIVICSVSGGGWSVGLINKFERALHTYDPITISNIVAGGLYPGMCAVLVGGVCLVSGLVDSHDESGNGK